MDVEEVFDELADLSPQLTVQQAGALSVNSCNADGFAPLHVAALHGRLALAALLTRHGAGVNARTNQSATPLHLACQNSHVQVGVKSEGVSFHCTGPFVSQESTDRCDVPNKSSIYMIKQKRGL